MRINELLKEKKWSQQQLAMKLNVSQATISAYTTSVRMPDVNTLIQMADLFHVSIDYIVGLSEIRNPISWSDLSEEEILHLNNYRALSKLNRKKIDDVILSILGR